MPQKQNGPNRTNRPNEPEPQEHIGRWKDVRKMDDVQPSRPGNDAYEEGAFGDAQRPRPIPGFPGSDDEAYPNNRELREALDGE